jgi:hypothetical protein
MYWYLNYLAKTRISHVERIKSFLLRAIDESRQRQQQHGSSLDRDSQFPRSLAFVKLAILDAAATWELSDALTCLYTVLGRLSLVRAPPRPYSTDALRYELRMRPFSTIGLPALPTFDEYSNGTLQPDTPSSDLLLYAEKAVGGAKKGFEHMSKLPEEEAFSAGSHPRWVAGMRNSLKACIATGIAVSAVRKAAEAAARDGTPPKIKVEVPRPDKAYHEWWIAPKVIPIV